MRFAVTPFAYMWQRVRYLAGVYTGDFWMKSETAPVVDKSNMEFSIKSRILERFLTLVNR